MKSASIRILHFVPNSGLFDKTVPNTLAAFQQLVGGLIEPVQLLRYPNERPHQAWLEVVVNEEGLLENLPVGWVWPTESARPLAPIFGSFFVALAVPDPEDGVVFTDLTDADVRFVCALFATEITQQPKGEGDVRHVADAT